MTDERSLGTNPSVYRYSVLAVGLLLICGIFVRWLVLFGGVQHVPSDTDPLIELTFTGGIAAFVALLGLWLAIGNHALPYDSYRRVLLRALTGFGMFTGLVGALLLVGSTISPNELTHYSWFAGAVGTGVGTVFGIQEANAVSIARRAERKETLAERVVDERERLEYLNAVLRHEVLNNVSIISGWSEMALAAAEGETRDHLATIHDRSEDMADVINDVRVLIEALQIGSAETQSPIDAAKVLEAEIEDLATTYESVRVQSDIHPVLWVTGDPLLARAFGNLLTNAIEHNDSPVPRISVTTELESDTVHISIADNGPGIPESKRGSLFERSGRGNHGLGMYIVASILDRCGGSVDLTETGPDGTTFTVTLPRATDTGEFVTWQADPDRTGDSQHEIRIRSQTVRHRSRPAGRAVAENGGTIPEPQSSSQ